MTDQEIKEPRKLLIEHKELTKKHMLKADPKQVLGVARQIELSSSALKKSFNEDCSAETIVENGKYGADFSLKSTLY